MAKKPKGTTRLIRNRLPQLVITVKYKKENACKVNGKVTVNM